MINEGAVAREVDHGEVGAACAFHGRPHGFQRRQNALPIGVVVDEHCRFDAVERILRIDDGARKAARVATGEFQAQVLGVFVVVLVDAHGEQMELRSWRNVTLGTKHHLPLVLC